LRGAPIKPDQREGRDTSQRHVCRRSSPTNGKGATLRSGTFATDQARPTGRARHFAAARLPPIKPDQREGRDTSQRHVCRRSSPTNGKGAIPRSGTFAAVGSLIDFFQCVKSLCQMFFARILQKNFSLFFVMVLAIFHIASILKEQQDLVSVIYADNYI